MAINRLTRASLRSRTKNRVRRYRVLIVDTPRFTLSVIVCMYIQIVVNNLIKRLISLERSLDEILNGIYGCKLSVLYIPLLCASWFISYFFRLLLDYFYEKSVIRLRFVKKYRDRILFVCLLGRKKEDCAREKSLLNIASIISRVSM